MKDKILVLLLSFFCGISTSFSQQVKLNSYATAAATIYLDFDGEMVSTPVWNMGNTIACAPSGLSQQQIAEVFNRVAEDYRPFNINITTDEDVFNAAPIDKKMRVIITPTSSWFANVGGVSYLGSFTWGDETPCFVFSDKLGPNNPKMVAECCSHESGHTLGLSHQSKYDDGCNLTATYHDGHGDGETAWAPIMGNSYYRNMSGWNNGPTPYGCSNSQDNLSIITTRNGFGYRTDDHSDDWQQSPTTIQLFNNALQGVISTNSDKDVFTFTLSSRSKINIEANPFNTGTHNSGADLDVKLSLYDADKNDWNVFNPINSMSVWIDTVLNAGTYYIIIEGTGNGNTSDYGSLGSYSLSANYQVVPVCNVILNASMNNAMHQLCWAIDCNEAVGNIVLQSSIDTVHYSELSNVTRQSHFSYSPGILTDIYYRLQVTTHSGNIFYSTPIVIRKQSGSPAFTVSAIVNHSIQVSAVANFSYQLYNMAGSRVAAGVGVPGYNNLDVHNIPAGQYILSLIGKGETKIQRLLKL